VGGAREPLAILLRALRRPFQGAAEGRRVERGSIKPPAGCRRLDFISSFSSFDNFGAVNCENRSIDPHLYMHSVFLCHLFLQQIFVDFGQIS
jgi:hypothetical protein